MLCLSRFLAAYWQWCQKLAKTGAKPKLVSLLILSVPLQLTQPVWANLLIALPLIGIAWALFLNIQ